MSKVSMEEQLHYYLQRAAEALKISGPNYKVELGSKKGDNYVADIYRVSIEGEKDGVSVDVKTILKIASKDDAKRLSTYVSANFLREHLFYTEIVPTFKNFLNTKNMDLEDIAQCYFSSVEDHNEAICLEDLRPKGFMMRDFMQVDFKHVSLAFRALGRLHAISFALRDQRPDIFASKIATLKEPVFTPEIIASKTVINRFEALAELAKTVLAEEEPKYIERFSAFANTILTRLEESCDGQNAEPYAVLCHGDFWSNNMLFKYDEDSGKPRDIYLLDFQVVRYASPATDLSHNFFISCGHDLRASHFDDLVKIYHDSLSAYLSELGSDPKKLFPFEALEDQLNQFSAYGAAIALRLLPIYTSQGDDVETIYTDDTILRLQERIKRDHYWRNIYRDAFKDLIDRNYI